MRTKKFTTVDADGNSVKLMVVPPSIHDSKEAGKVYNQAFNDALKSKAIVRARLDDILAEQGLWDEKKQAEYNRIQAELLESERVLKKGGISLSKARDVALQMRKTRDELRELISDRTTLDNHTAEGQADNAKFNYLVYAQVVYEDNPSQKYFKSYEDYMQRSNESAGIAAAQNVANFTYGLEDNYEKTLPENEFLIKYKFVDNALRFINKEGKFTDEEGRLIDVTGRYIDAEGNYIDKNGNRVDENGEYIVDFAPFLDDEGKPVVLDDVDTVDEKPKKSAKKTKAKEESNEDKVDT